MNCLDCTYRWICACRRISAKSDHNRLKWANLSLKDLIFNFTYSFGLYYLLAFKHARHEHVRLPSSNILFSLKCFFTLSKILLQWSTFVEKWLLSFSLKHSRCANFVKLSEWVRLSASRKSLKQSSSKSLILWRRKVLQRVACSSYLR